MNSVEDRLSHEAVNERLPWFVNGTLPDDERVMVADHLEQCETCQADLRLCEEMAASVRSGRAVPIPSVATADDLLAGVEQAPLRPFQFDWRIAAALVVIVISGAVALSLGQRSELPNQVFTTLAEGSSVATVDYVFEIRFDANVDEAARQRVLDDLGGEALVAEQGTATYHVTMSIAPRSLAELDEIAAGMAGRPGVVSADIVALQVPVR